MILVYCIKAGLYTLPNILLGEIFPSNIKGIVSLITNLLSNLAIVSVVVTITNVSYPISTDYRVYFLLSLFVLIGSTVTIFFIPETKGKTLQEIKEECQ